MTLVGASNHLCEVLTRQSKDNLCPMLLVHYITEFKNFCFVCNCYLGLLTDVGGPIESGSIALLAGDEQKLQLLKQKISENASATPVVATRMKECMKRIENYNHDNRVIYPAFKRKRN